MDRLLSFARAVCAFVLVFALGGCSSWFAKGGEKAVFEAPDGTWGSYGARVSAEGGLEHIVRLRLAKDGRADLLVDFLDRAPVIAMTGAWDYRFGARVRVELGGDGRGGPEKETLTFTHDVTGLTLARSSLGGIVPEGTVLERNIAVSGPVWRLVRIRHADNTTIVPADPSRYALVLSADQTVTVLADCNRGMGTFLLAGRALVMRDFAFTRMICAEGSLFEEYTDALKSAWSCWRGADTLGITFERGKASLEFEQAPERD